MRYHNITTADMMNGEGLRVVLWLSGCSHRCYNCQNPVTWDENDGLIFDESAKEELFRELDKDYISGLTLSGGDPLHEANLDGVLELVNRFRLLLPNKSIWLYSGYAWEDIMKYEYGSNYINNFNTDALRQYIVSKCDVLVDGRYIDAQRNVQAKWRGSDNQRVINIQESLKQGKVVLYCD